jgi:glycosyltransferase involved in cell wall biosynthesis
MTDLTVLHYLGYDSDDGGIVSVVRALADAGQFRCVLGVNEGFAQRRTPRLEAARFSKVHGETISPANLLACRRVARECCTWLAGGPRRIVHLHSRAGMLVGWWLERMRERRAVVSVHCYGKHRWFYRYVAQRLRGRVYWLTPSMRAYYGFSGPGWAQCIPGCVPGVPQPVRQRSESETKLLLGGIGALVRWKRWDLVLQALATLSPHERQQIRFTHFGGPLEDRSSKEYASILYRTTRELGLDEVVDWAGHQPSTKSLLERVHVIATASDQEPFSIGMLEALFHGVPVLAADSGGARDVIHPPLHGWLFRSGDAISLAAALRDLLSREFRNSAVFDLPELSRFSSTNVAGQWVQAYRALLR